MKRFFAILCLIPCLFVLSSCDSTTQQTSSPQLLLGFSQLGSESSWRLGNTQSMQDAATAHGISLMLENANQKQENQVDAIRSFIAYRVDVIVFSPIVEEGWDNVLTEAKNANIPVILVDRLIKTADENLYAGYIGADFMQEGVNAANYLLRKADDLGVENLNIVEITGTVDSTPMRQRSLGFHNTLGDDTRFTILESTSGDFLRSKGQECMEDLIRQYGSTIDVLYSHNDGMTLGAIQAIEDAGLIPGKDIIIITVDGEREAIDQLINGKINCVVECTPKLGDLVMEMAKNLVAGNAVEKVTHPTEECFTEYDDLSSLPLRGY